jgi:hypothetical protein
MKIAFKSQQTNLNLGSYRIWIDNLCGYFKNIDVVASINPKDIDEYDVIIFTKDKGLVTNKQNTKYKNKKIGIINPRCDNIPLLKNADFIIVGSIEEKESLISHNKNCFIFPLIEKMYQNVVPKIHNKKKTITIGYHGNQNHLNHMNNGLKWALEKLSETVKIKLVIICSNDREWKRGKPDIDIVFIQWNIKTIVNDIQQFDIGIVPTISEIYKENELNTNMALGLYNTDYKIRFKNKSNIGRSLVLFQCGIPVVADIIPSNMHILANPDNGYAVASKEGWYYAMQELCCEKRRNFISKNAYNECRRLYSPIEWVSKLSTQIKSI